MKKTLGCVLLGILAVVLIGYGITSAVEKKDPVITEGTVNDAYNNAATKGILAGDTAPSEGTSASSAASTTAAAAANAVEPMRASTPPTPTSTFRIGPCCWSTGIISCPTTMK